VSQDNRSFPLRNPREFLVQANCGESWTMADVRHGGGFLRSCFVLIRIPIRASLEQCDFVALRGYWPPVSRQAIKGRCLICLIDIHRSLPDHQRNRRLPPLEHAIPQTHQSTYLVPAARGAEPELPELWKEEVGGYWMCFVGGARGGPDEPQCLPVFFGNDSHLSQSK
jgi:hypothetical protein